MTPHESIEANLQKIRQNQWSAGWRITLYVDGVGREWNRGAMPEAVEAALPLAVVLPFRTSAC